MTGSYKTFEGERAIFALLPILFCGILFSRFPLPSAKNNLDLWQAVLRKESGENVSFFGSSSRAPSQAVRKALLSTTSINPVTALSGFSRNPARPGRN
jgi:hypothetical protein